MGEFCVDVYSLRKRMSQAEGHQFFCTYCNCYLMS